MYASFSGHADCISLLLDRGADVNAQAEYDLLLDWLWSRTTASSLANRGGHSVCAKLLLEHGASQ
jgi:ankyrin repeat protein